jgi:hypothetical protein
MDTNLISACQMFLVPASILFAALGVASTEQLKTLVSVMGLATSAVWAVRVWLWSGLTPVDSRTAGTLAFIFVAAWIIALLAHARLWYLRG